MNQGHLEEELLHRYFDGELRPSELSAVERHLSACADCQAKERALGKLRSALEIAAEDAARDVDFGALYGRIEQGVRAGRTPSLWERLAVWWRDMAEQRPAQLWVPAGALAAGAVLFAVLQAGGPEVEQSIAGRDSAADEPASEPQDLARRAPPEREKTMFAAVSSEVEQVDFGDNAGTVFEIALADGVSTPVVWINDDVQ